MGKKCSVPYCNTGSRKYKERHPMYGVPKDDFFLNKWQEAIGRDDRPIHSGDVVCRKHFKPDDFVLNRIIRGEVEEYKVPKLKPDAVPSVFPEIPDCIHGTVKKRRKLSVDAELFKKAHKKETKDIERKFNSDQEVEELDKKDIDRIKEEPKENTQASNKCDIPSQNVSENGAIKLIEVLLKDEIQIKEEEDVKQESCNDIKDEKEEITEEVVSGPKIFHCTLCDYSTKWPHNLQTHQTKHLEGEEHYFKCDKCPQFKTKWITTYKNHMKMKHSTDPVEVFKCSYCSYETKVKSCLKRHTDTHLTAKKHNEHLSTSPKNRRDSKNHKNIDQTDANIENSVFSCAKCDFQTSCHKSLLSHFVTSSCYIYKEPKINPRFHCKECNFECGVKADFLKHTLSHRNTTVEKVKRTRR